MKKQIEENVKRQGIVCDECGLPIDYEKLNNGAYTVGGIGINWEKMGAIKIAAPDTDDKDFHKECLDKASMRAEPVELKKVKPELFRKKNA